MIAPLNKIQNQMENYWNRKHFGVWNASKPTPKTRMGGREMEAEGVGGAEGGEPVTNGTGKNISGHLTQNTTTIR